ncbi:HpcH/HpaI aldolase/citrate lyase family protein [Micromonospora endophytica]|uniref:CoA ester lyase n=1 Tax=Micromonospora endophytica TaxID=515350 RepID=A0A2W2CHL3_9ACTN|nr:CoA ester lyase [Micromonospora endophytica]PZF98895.1 CoA ester lyase [Micromonospora endophytica]RIW44368.1 CoA ester lyase [Micromonospora endophytica]BCJ62434.1 malyl-CoA lyase [Micromonospora endophytica]
MSDVARSYLYVPGDRADVLRKAAGRGADALVLDLEDAVALPHKEKARETVAAYLRDAPSGVAHWVRVNSDQVETDLTVLGASAAGIWLPKAEPDLLHEVDRALLSAERRLGLPERTFQVVALIETARGALACAQVAIAPRVLRLGIGEADLAGELGLQPDADRTEFAAIRSQVVLASAAARITPPVGPVETVLHDPVRLEKTSRALLRQGFRARSAIHPGQLATINGVFTPTPEEVAAARRVLDAMARAERDGSGVAVDDHGRLVDRAVVRSAAEVLSRAEA